MARPVPFCAGDELVHWLPVGPTNDPKQEVSNNGKPWSMSDLLPGQPRISIRNAGFWPYLKADLLTLELDGITPWLWLVSTPSSANIAPLHDHVARGRTIFLSENPRIHLTWVDGKLFLKPIPKYLLSYNFWETYLCSPKSLGGNDHGRTSILAAALGFMRSYYYLIQYESDFNLALENHLIAPGITYDAFVSFIGAFGQVSDDLVCHRYQYGTLRLSRLNAWSWLLLRRFTYHEVHWTYGAYFIRIFGPLIFLYASASVFLDGLQVALQADPRMDLAELEGSWKLFRDFAKWMSIALVILTVVVTLVLGALLTIFLLREMLFVVRWILKGRRSKRKRQSGDPLA